MRLTKHHGLRNDFLVLLDPDDELTVDGPMARAVCDRRSGVGADGLIRATVDDGRIRMHLRNSDGSRAEISGNGLRCLAQAVVLAGLAEGPDVVIDTDAGPRAARVVPTDQSEVHQVRVDMGAVRAGVEAQEWCGDGVAAARFADAGNPHLVLHVPDPDEGPDLVEVGERANAEVEGGVNVELITPDGRHDLDLAVFERGSGVTAACGSGAVAAAVVARAWDLVGDVTSVHMPGGTAQVEVEDTVWLSGPTVVIASVDWPHPGAVG